MMFSNPRVRAVAAAGTALVVVAGIGIGVVNSSQAASARYVSARVGTGDVVQTYIATGTISRDNTADAAFTVGGTVKSVDVAVGDRVDAGDQLATLKRGPLQLAVLDAETSVAKARASLYAAENPASASTGSSGGAGAGSVAGSGAGSVTIDPAVLKLAVSRINLAVLSESQKCEPVFGSILPAPEPTATATPTATGSATPTATPTASGSPSATVTPTATATPTVAETTPAAEPTATAGATTIEAAAPEPTAAASQLEAAEANDPSRAELQECANARAEVLAANANLQTVVTALTTPVATRTTTVKKSSSSSGSGSSPSNTRAVAAAKATLLKAQQDLQAAGDDLDAATLVAPISGTIGVVGLTRGDSAGSNSITIVGTGNAVVTFELPLATRKLVTVGQEVTVTPAGSTTAMTGKLTAISSLETSGTSGSTASYTTTVAVSDAEGLLATGAKASATIAVKSSTGVVRVPASAATPTGTGTATVSVIDSASATTTTTTTVKTGAVGGGWVEITEGLQAGQLVVLADTTAAIPANANRRRTSTTSTASGSASATAVPTGGATSPAPTRPTASASR